MERLRFAISKLETRQISNGTGAWKDYAYRFSPKKVQHGFIVPLQQTSTMDDPLMLVRRPHGEPLADLLFQLLDCGSCWQLREGDWAIDSNGRRDKLKIEYIWQSRYVLICCCSHLVW